MEKSFKQLYKEAEQRDSYWTAKASLDFTEELCARMEKESLSKADLAKKLGCSRAYITKILKGDSDDKNLTLATMVKLARVVGCTVDLHLSDAATIGSVDFQADAVPTMSYVSPAYAEKEGDDAGSTAAVA